VDGPPAVVSALVEETGSGRSATPQAAARRWVEAVMDNGDLDAAWPLTDPVLRLVLAQDWIWTHRHEPRIGHDRDWESIARELATCPSTHELWESFTQEQIAYWHTIWKGFSTLTWGVWDEPEVVSLDMEMVTFMESDGRPVRFAPGRSAFARRFAMRHGPEGWLVAGVNGDQLFRPGWPPTLEA